MLNIPDTQVEERLLEVTKRRAYERCIKCQTGKVLLTVEDQALCYACIVCMLYADMDTAELATWLGRSRRAIAMVATTHGVYKSANYLATHDCGRIQPGNVPANKGLRRPGWAPGRMASTQFKHGQINGHAAEIWKPIGTERLSKDGYVEVKVREREGRFGNWVGKHIVLWQAAHGPVPAGHAVCFRDGDKTHIALDNFELLSRRQLMARNTVHNLPKELADVIQLSGALKRRLRRLSEKQGEGSVQPSL